MSERPTLTTEAGAPVVDNQRSETAGAGGPVLVQDHHLLEKLAHFNRERIPERIVHAVGIAAYGELEITEDVSRYTRAKLFQPGAKTEMLARFSTVAGSKGAPDTARDPRGFALKFYTEDGNYDLVGNNTPIFFIRDAIKFPDFIHSQKYDPRTNQQEPDNVWDFFGLHPATTHQFTWLFGDRGRPASVRNMDGFGSHTFQWINAEAESVWVKYHFKTNQGIKHLTDREAEDVGGKNPEFHLQDLREHIESGDFPSWSLEIQVMPLADAATYRFNPFDVTKIWSQKDYPRMKVGTMTLNRWPENYFAEVEQSAFSPSHFVDGIGPSPDKMLQGRLFAYPDAHRYRVGANANELPVNAPRKTTVASYQRDGAMTFSANGGGSKNYEPNSFDGPVQTDHELYNGLEAAGASGHFDYEAHTEDGDFGQAGDLYRLMSPEEQERLVGNIAGSLSQVSRDDIIERAVASFRSADPTYGDRVAAAVKDLREGKSGEAGAEEAPDTTGGF
jgi:catalase